MAAPTNVRVESNSITTNTLNWTYGGTGDIAVFRSPDGVTYSEVTTVQTRVAAGTTTYTDVGLTTNTKYWYKLSDDAGATFSSVVTVVTQTCGQPPSQFSDTVLPRSGDQVTPQDFNDLSQKVESNLVRFTDPEGRVCLACVSSDGALVIDCVNYANCDTVQVDVTGDINSISMPNCTNDIKQIDFIIPPNTTRKICGWPGGGGFTGDECFQAPLSGGSTGRTYSVGTSGGKASPTQSGSRPGYPTLPRTGGGGGRGGSDCTCVPNGNGALTIKSCTANNSLGCSGSKKLTLIACGGRAPYAWSNTGSVTLSSTSGNKITVTPPTNSGSAVAGTAYRIGTWIRCTTGGGIIGNRMFTKSYGCDDAGGSCTTNSANNNQYDPDGPCPGGDCCSFCGDTGSACTANQTGSTVSKTVADCTGITCDDGGGTMCDARSATMISSGCNPCGLQQGSTVSVTDALGVVATIVLRR